MPTSSFDKKFVIEDEESLEKFLKALDNPRDVELAPKHDPEAVGRVLAKLSERFAEETGEEEATEEDQMPEDWPEDLIWPCCCCSCCGCSCEEEEER